MTILRTYLAYVGGSNPSVSRVFDGYLRRCGLRCVLLGARVNQDEFRSWIKDGVCYSTVLDAACG